MRREQPEIETDEPPSKSERKREAHAAQALGEELIGMSAAELAPLSLPEDLLAALAEARRIKSRAALVRQRQYIGKLMRDLDLEPIRARLAARSEQTSREAEAFKRIEAWRDRLVSEGPEALEALMSWRPEADRTQLARLIAAAQRERAAGAMGPSGRELFRVIRALFSTMPQ